MRHFLLAAVAGLALASTAPAFAMGIDASTYGSGAPQQISGTVHLSPDHVVSLAQLQAHLQKLGYSDIRLSNERPNLLDPRPDLTDDASAATMRSAVATTPAHLGWNGTAVRNGKRVSIIIG